MQIKKRTWKSKRKVLPAYVGIAIPNGNSSRPTPYLPPECAGKFTITIVVMDDEELEKALKELIGGGNEEQ
jgi:hypothetical protein